MENIIIKGNITVHAPVDIKALIGIAWLLSPIHRRPLSHHTKRGPGRKHQQTKTLTKQQRQEKNHA